MKGRGGGGGGKVPHMGPLMGGPSLPKDVIQNNLQCPISL